VNARPSAEDIAQAFHKAYEDLAPQFGYRTREASAKPWSDVPEQNRLLMVATVQRLIDQDVIR
jgi:cytochrome c551/c552